MTEKRLSQKVNKILIAFTAGQPFLATKSHLLYGQGNVQSHRRFRRERDVRRQRRLRRERDVRRQPVEQQRHRVGAELQQRIDRHLLRSGLRTVFQCCRQQGTGR
jgi:hypothetical protein